MFNKLHEAFIKDREAQRAANLFYINHGYMSTWSEENQKSSDPDNGIRRYSTETSWNNYKAGLITRERAAELATRRMNNEINKSIKEGTAELQAAYDAEDIDRIDISVSWKRNRTWGANPTAEVYANGWTTGTASGCGYDKESAAVAAAFNRNPAILKQLYSIKEKALEEGKTDTDTTACTGHDNRNIVGYGAGYSVIPYFEGGVGVGCFWSILKKAGYTTEAHYGKHDTFYTVTKA